ncbi:Casein kinase I isoform alpha [Thelohanellus kitauei]|uniref:non-specific serine/threonine protein kinase n=1 Tax=Thelohanellus kitauei TaxID=669202 RepID=A0A0C2MEN9_THEKT|nr:Casein kinase I isoform alpha [Thelohanellus kitauei]
MIIPDPSRPKIWATTLIGERYEIMQSIGKGSFGEVFLAVDRLNKSKVAIKIEELVKERSQLTFESKIYKYLSDGVNILNTKLYEIDRNTRALVMELLGPSIEELHKRCKCKFTLKTVCLLADQMISLLEYLHLRSIIHRDLKPDNFLMGLADTSKVYIVDFGLSKQYAVSRVSPHIEYRTKKHMIGTVRYASINSHLGIEQSRRDDLEALGYVLLYLFLGKLPWQGIQCNDKKRKYNLICERKLALTLDSLCRQVPEQFGEYMRYVYHLRFDQKPDYMLLRQLFRQMMQHNNIRVDNAFDWTFVDEAKALFTRFDKVQLPSRLMKTEMKPNQTTGNVIKVNAEVPLQAVDGTKPIVNNIPVTRVPVIPHKYMKPKDLKPEMDSLVNNAGHRSSTNLEMETPNYPNVQPSPAPRYNLRSLKREESVNQVSQQNTLTRRRDLINPPFPKHPL